jgi:hypothetical protein
MNSFFKLQVIRSGIQSAQRADDDDVGGRQCGGCLFSRLVSSSHWAAQARRSKEMLPSKVDTRETLSNSITQDGNVHR